MILTRTYLNARRAGARKLLGSPQAMHAAILAGFAPGVDPGRVLWRCDPIDPMRPALYVVSKSRPDFAHLEEQAGWPTQPTTESASYAPLLDSLAQGQEWGFRLTANPTHRAVIGDRRRIVAHVTVAQQLNWLLERADRLGISFGEAEAPNIQLIHRETRSFRREKSTVTLGTATFGGVLRVEDADLLREALVSGIGRAKAYGCGLMTLARP
ncbi:type I-E CRISPR-associated protein Cas6/Cse3/CasE [Enemella sp. A6]|uniref:type I-E CRISPR-associated protein Cas6/Cse3/CasE n=1 Tax=Enemella sp. A6 TaxID=3440152 RepID=UPI003EB6E7A0